MNRNDFNNGCYIDLLKEYKKDGTPVTSYPEIQFREIDLLASKNRVGECPGQEV